MYLRIYFGKLVVIVSLMELLVSTEQAYISAIGDPGMRRDDLRVSIEAWNQCNEVGEEAPRMGSPRKADCFEVNFSTSPIVSLVHKVDEEDNLLGISNASSKGNGDLDVNQYAAWKELYLGNICQVQDGIKPWHFWTIMVKSGNMDTLAATCPNNGKKVNPFPQSVFPCFGQGCMNMPLMYHHYTSVQGYQGSCILRGSFYGTWDLDADMEKTTIGNGTSYYSVTWEKVVGKGSWNFHHLLKTSSKYPWLMLYLRADSTKGFSGGYHYQTRGILRVIPKSPYFKVKFTLEVRQGGGNRSQFYLLDIGSCWKNNGQPCDGDVTTDVTRYSEMILNPNIYSECNPSSLGSCPVCHTFANGTRVHRTDEENFPYKAYHLYCSPGNAIYSEKPHTLCDPYSNPQPQEILQILPHPVWGEYGYPTKQGEGWIGNPTTWELDVGRLSQALYFYQDPGSPPAKRYWPSINVGTEIFASKDEVTEWTITDFDVFVPQELYSQGTMFSVKVHEVFFFLIFFHEHLSTFLIWNFRFLHLFQLDLNGRVESYYSFHCQRPKLIHMMYFRVLYLFQLDQYYLPLPLLLYIMSGIKTHR